MPRVAILYGMTEGKAHLYRLAPALRQAGFDIVDDISAADCILVRRA